MQHSTRETFDEEIERGGGAGEREREREKERKKERKKERESALQRRQAELTMIRRTITRSPKEDSPLSDAVFTVNRTRFMPMTRFFRISTQKASSRGRCQSQGHVNASTSRIVYDGSAKTAKPNKSLNDCLVRGPVLLQDLAGILLRFRTQHIAVTADIEKAFLQMSLHLAEADLSSTDFSHAVPVNELS